MTDLTGTPNDDTLHGTTGQNVSGGGGNDTITSDGGHNVVLSGGAGNDTIIAGPDGQILRGGDGADLLVGGTGNDNMGGGAGNDVLRGGDGNDLLFGGSGNDNLGGGTGQDIFQFNYQSGQDSGNDTIVDFQLGTDTLQLMGNAGSPGASVNLHTQADFQSFITALNQDTSDGYYATQFGDDVWLHLGSGDSIRLSHLDAGSIFTF